MPETPPPIEIDFLKGVRVLLIAHYLPGPTAAYLLRMLGAEVIKVEPPFHDMLRMYPPYLEGSDPPMGAYFRAVNAGFKSVVLDFKQPEGVAALRDLIGVSDVLIDGNRPGYLQSVLGAAPPAFNDDLVHIPVSAWGIAGPRAMKAGHDNNILGRTGLLSYTSSGPEGQPSVFSAQVADINAAYMAAFMAVAAVLGKVNQFSKVAVDTIDTSMLHAGFFLNQIQVAAFNATATSPQADKEWMNGGMANYRLYRSQDDVSLFFGPIEPKLFENFCRHIERPDLIPLLYAENEKLIAELEEIFKGKSSTEWGEFSDACDCCLTVVQNLEAALNDPQVAALGLVQGHPDGLKMAGYPAGFGRQSQPPETRYPAPTAGAHTREVLEDLLGYTPAQVAALTGKGA